MEGLVAILITPFTEDGRIDEAGIRHMVKAAVAKDLDGVVVLGSNAEFPYLRLDEKIQVMGAAVDAAEGKIPVVGTASAWSTELAVELANEAEKAGCNAVMAALPLYFKLEFKDAVNHYKTLAEKGGLPIYYYHFPGVTGLNCPPSDLARIAEIDGVIGAKITVINRPYLKKTIKATQKFNWKVFTGTSLLLYDCLDFGGAGVFCPLPLIGAEDVKSVWSGYKAGDKSRSKKSQSRLLLSIPLFTGSEMPTTILARGFKAMVRLPIGIDSRPFASHCLVKEALRIQGHPITGKVRRPNMEANEDQKKLVEKTLADLEWL